MVYGESDSGLKHQSE